MRLDRIDDPRTPLQKRRRAELWDYARRHNIQEIAENMPAKLMRKRLMARGVSDLDKPLREPILGAPANAQRHLVGDVTVNVPQVDALDDLERQYQEQVAAAERPKAPPRESLDGLDGLTGLARLHAARRMCKDRGLTIVRGMKLADFERLLNGQDAS